MGCFYSVLLIRLSWCNRTRNLKSKCKMSSVFFCGCCWCRFLLCMQPPIMQYAYTTLINTTSLLAPSHTFTFRCAFPFWLPGNCAAFTHEMYEKGFGFSLCKHFFFLCNLTTFSACNECYATLQNHLNSERVSFLHFVVSSWYSMML